MHILPTGRAAAFPVLVALLAAGGCARGSSPPQVVARVGDAVLTVADLEANVPADVLERADRNDLLAYANQWIRSELLYQAAREMGYAGDERVRQRVRDAERDIMVDLFLQDELDMRMFISEEEISAYHANNQDAFRREETEVLASMLWFADEESARRARAALEAGTGFGEIAADTSYGVRSSELNRRYVTREELGEALGGAIFGLEPGVLSSPIGVEDTFLIARVEDRQEAGTVRALWEVREDIEARLASDLREAKLETMLSELLAAASVSIDVDGALSALRNPPVP